MKSSHATTVQRCFVALLVVGVWWNGRAQNQEMHHWVTAYYGGWELGTGSNGYLPVSEVDFSSMTHVVHFALVPRPDGSLDSAGNDITFQGSHALVSAAHKVGTKVLISLGGWNSESGFEGATSSGHITSFLMNILTFMSSRGYDGVDIDWEPLNPQDYKSYEHFMHLLREGMGSKFILTTTAGQGYDKVMKAVEDDVDQINIMTYDLSFPSAGWVTWYNGALHQNGVTFASTGGPVPACDNIVDSFLASGISADKIGIGIEFGGSVWKGGLTPEGNGVTAPVQSWTVAPTLTPDVPYYTILKTYYLPERYHWDAGAKASYLSIDSSGSAGDCFVSYEDTNDIIAKINYVKQKDLGGVILYELGMGYLGNGRNPLLDVVKKSMFSNESRIQANGSSSQH